MQKGKDRRTPVTFSPDEVARIKSSIALSAPGEILCPRCSIALVIDRHLEGGTALRCSECKRTCLVRRDLRD